MPRKIRLRRPWTHTVGSRPHSLTLIERLDRGGNVYLRWWDASRKRFQLKGLGFAIRGPNGTMDLGLRDLAMERALNAYQGLLQGKSPENEEGPKQEKLTLEGGLRLATRVPGGMYVTESPHLDDMRRGADYIVNTIGIDDTGKLQTWETLKYRQVRTMWTRLAQHYKQSAGKRGGPTNTERCVVLLIQVSSWLVFEAELIPAPLSMPKNWRVKLREDWARITGREVPEPNRPRHSAEEVTKILASLKDDRVDQRIALALILGAELRLGQVARLMRSDLELIASGHYRVGRLVVRGTGKKLGVIKDLTPEERSAVDEAMRGYLRDLECAFAAGLRSDYPLFPAGVMPYDVKPSRRPQNKRKYVDIPCVRRASADVQNEPSDDRSMRDWFDKLESVAGVNHVRGRGWYGIRRVASDVYPDYEDDARVLNDATGHADSKTREKTYQEKNSSSVRARTAQTRRKVRAGAFGFGSADQS